MWRSSSVAWKKVAYKRELFQTALVYYGNNKSREEEEEGLRGC
jgi:hypothetical protein